MVSFFVARVPCSPLLAALLMTQLLFVESARSILAESPETQVGKIASDLGEPVAIIDNTMAADRSEPLAMLDNTTVIPTLEGCTCATAWTHDGKIFNGCTMYKWPKAWCGTNSKDCGVCDTQTGPYGCWDDCLPGSPMDTSWEEAISTVASLVTFYPPSDQRNRDNFVTDDGTFNETFSSQFRKVIAEGANVDADNAVKIAKITIGEDTNNDTVVQVACTIFFTSTSSELAEAFARTFASMAAPESSTNAATALFPPTFEISSYGPRSLSADLGMTFLPDSDVPVPYSEHSPEEMQLQTFAFRALKGGY